MTYKEGWHIYLAAPFFNDEQRDLCTFVEGLSIRAEGTEGWPIYSPRLDGGVLKPDSNDFERQEVFESNTNAIGNASWVLAVIDNFDAGVLWEMGYAHAVKTPTLGYSDVEGRGLNVMLAGSCDLGFINGREALKEILTRTSPFPRNTWRGKIQ